MSDPETGEVHCSHCGNWIFIEEGCLCAEIISLRDTTQARDREIERLRERIEELDETIAFLDPPYGILELQDQLDAANALVEELENHLKKAIHDMGGIITHEQIAEAWAYRCSALEKSQHDENGDYWMEFVDGLINKIGIFRCEGCSACDPLVLKSQVCNGKGYLIKEVVDDECEHV